MNSKSEVAKLFQEFYYMVENQFQTKRSILRSHNGTEFYNDCLGDLLQEKGILHQSTCRDTPQQNGIAKRKNRHLLEVGRALMFHMNVPTHLWGDAILTSCYLINRMPTRVLNYATPSQTLKNTFPNTRLTLDLPSKNFGCTVFVHVPTHLRSKFDPRTKKCIFLGYAPNKKGYKCFNPTTRKIHASMDVNFIENIPFYNKTTLQGESSNEDRFWQQEQPKPSIFLPKINQKTNVLISEKGGNTDLSMPNKIASQTGGETLQPMSTELCVYTRCEFNSNTENNQVNLEHGQSSTPSSQNPDNLPMDSTPLPIFDLDIPIAI